MIISVDTFRDRTGIGTQSQVVDHARSCILGAEGYVSEYLRTEFNSVSGVSELFQVDPSDERYSTELLLALRRGIVRDVSITGYSTFPLESGSVIKPKNFILSSSKGVITIPDAGSALAGIRYLKVSYSAGYEKDAHGRYKDVPAAIQEAALILAEDIFNGKCMNKGGSCISRLGLSHLLDSALRFFPQAVRSLGD
jgi:hypothetical protein